MDSITPSRFFHNWSRKLLALIGAIAIWLFVNQSITATKTISNVPVRLINMRPDRTIEGLLPNGILGKRLTLILTGTKDVIENIEPSDIEVVVDAGPLPDESVVQITKKNLISLNPDIDLVHHITSVQSNELLIKLSKLITEKIPIVIGPPIGEAPEAYQFLDIWPQQLFQTVTGPEEYVLRLQEKGLVLALDLSKVTKAELNAIQGSSGAFRGDEVVFPVPADWKKVVLSSDGDRAEFINDPLAKELVISFLRKELIPFGINIPVRVYYPVVNSATVNPKTYPLQRGGWLTERNNITLTPLPLLASNVSRWFVDVIRDNIEITIVAVEKSDREPLQWAIEIANLSELENIFVAFLLGDNAASNASVLGDPKKRDARLRRRFREYTQKLRLYKASERPLILDCRLQDNAIIARDVSGAD